MNVRRWFGFSDEEERLFATLFSQELEGIGKLQEIAHTNAKLLAPITASTLRNPSTVMEIATILKQTQKAVYEEFIDYKTGKTMQGNRTLNLRRSTTTTHIKIYIARYQI